MIRTIIAFFLLSSSAYAQVFGGGGVVGGGGGGPAAPDASLDQYQSNGTTVIAVGGSSADTTVVFSATAQVSSFLDIQLGTPGTNITASPIYSSALTAAGQTASIQLDDIPNGTYKWRARHRVSGGGTSSWVAFGANGGTGIDFVIDQMVGYQATFQHHLGWTMVNSSANVGWAIDNNGVPGYSAPNSLNYNDGTDYDTGGANNGTATSIAFDVSTLTTPDLRFWMYHDTDGVTDEMWVEIIDQATGNVLQTTQITGAAPTTWAEQVIGLTASWGNVQIRFRFDTVDGVNNTGAGWFVDDLTVADGTPGGGTTSGGGATGSNKENDNGDGNFLRDVCSAGSGSGSFAFALLLFLGFLLAVKLSPKHLNHRS